jgi:hypothetical protein
MSALRQQQMFAVRMLWNFARAASKSGQFAAKRIKIWLNVY